MPAGRPSAWSFLLSAGILKVIDLVMGLRVTPEEEELGLDLSRHGEVAYQLDFGQGLRAMQNAPQDGQISVEDLRCETALRVSRVVPGSAG